MLGLYKEPVGLRIKSCTTLNNYIPFWINNAIKQWRFRLGPEVWHRLPVSASPHFLGGLAAYELPHPECKLDMPPLTLKFVQYFNIFLRLLRTKSPDPSFDFFEKLGNPPYGLHSRHSQRLSPVAVPLEF